MREKQQQPFLQAAVGVHTGMRGCVSAAALLNTALCYSDYSQAQAPIIMPMNESLV